MLPAASRFRRWVAAALLVGVAAAGVVFFWPRPASQARVPASAFPDDGLDEPLLENPGYVGLQACAACHATRVAQYEKTNHFRACREPRPGAMPEAFAPGKGTFAARELGLRFEMSRASDEFLHTAIQASTAGEKRTSTPIAWVYGAGDADEVYFGWHGDRLYELPISWLHPQQQWGISPNYRHSAEADFSREATLRCVECHNTWVGHVAGTANQYERQSAILGITCERCHGPGREHVAFHQAHPEAKAAEFIVRPTRLNRDRQMDLCAQCHSNAIKHRGPAFNYRPGQPLDESYKTLSPQRPEDDRVANQAQYLRQSKCFKESETLTCVTCHDPHRPTIAAAKAAVEDACLKCHAPASCGEQPRLPEAVRGECAACHMPKGVKINVHFHTENDDYVAPILRSQHEIGIYPAANKAVLLAWHRKRSDAKSRQEADRLASDLVAYWLLEAENYRRSYRFMAAIAALREALRVDPTPAVRARLKEATALVNRLDADSIEAGRQLQNKRYPEAIAIYERILRRKPDQAMAHGMLGMLLAMTGREERAVEELQAVARYDPDEPFGFMQLGGLKYLQGKADEAVEYYRQADAVEPFDTKINHHLGLALLELGQPAEAAERLRRAVTIDPRNAGAYQALSLALRRQRKSDAAIDCARRAARLTHYENPDVLMSLAETYADARMPREADDAVVKALEAARRNNPGLLPMIHRRGEEIRLRAKQPREQEEEAK